MCLFNCMFNHELLDHELGCVRHDDLGDLAPVLAQPGSMKLYVIPVSDK